jgi:Ca2+-binding RTX toxin-like protein
VSAGEASGDVLANFVNVMGSDHNDTLKGTSGNNFLFGGLGADTMTGDTGSDVFLFKSLAESNGDHVTDFETGSDHLAVGFTTGVTNFDGSGTPVAADGNAWFLYDTDDGKLYFDADGNGAGAKVLFITLDNAPTLLVTDIVLI